VSAPEAAEPRGAAVSFEPHMRVPEGHGAPPLYFCVHDGAILIDPGGGGGGFPDEPPPGRRHVLGSLGERNCFAVDVEDGRDRSPYEWIGLRQLYGAVAEQLWQIAGLATQIVQWDRTNRFCGRCGSETVREHDERARRCPNCGLSAFPRVAPAVIVLVTRGEHEEQALLAWSRRWESPVYSTLAGFVEPGEDLEQTVRREIKEETAIEVDRISYFGSQPWPFPHQLMVGFRARYAGGEIRVQESELVEARWFTAAELDQVQAVRGRMSISAWLVEGWLREQRGDS
jgi:NAD+ diphosphatase